MPKRKLHWLKSIVSLGVFLVAMPLIHLVARVLKDNYDGTQLLAAGMAVGLVGFAMVVVGVFVKGDTRQTLLGLIGGLLFWTGWVDFLFMYAAARWGTQAEIDPLTGALLSRPEYLLLPATFGMWAMVMTLYVFCSRNACNLINWVQSRLLGSRKREIAARPMTRHTSIVTFMEIVMMLWTCYLLLMFCYDSQFLGREHPVTFAVGFGSLLSSFYVFRKQLHLPAWGANIRMATATLIVFWIAVESFTRTHIITKLIDNPAAYPWHWVVMAAEIVALVIIRKCFYNKHEKANVAKAS